MALVKSQTRPGFGAISLKLTKQGSDFDFLGFEVWETDDQYAVADEVLIDRVENVLLTDYTFHFNKSPGTYYFNGYAIDFARNRSVPVNLTITIDRWINIVFDPDPRDDFPRIGLVGDPSYPNPFYKAIDVEVNTLNVQWLVIAEDLI